jgi:mannobiose 2-epimerase
MNTHLHLIEAYTCHLRVNDIPQVRNKVREQLYVMLNKIVNHDTHHYHYFQDRQWNPTSTAISFGHDIEGSWLMMETAEVLGEPEAFRAARDTCVNMARTVLEEGFREDGALLTEYDPVTGEYSEYLSWWEQNEAVVGFLNAWELTGEEHFLDASLKCFEYINKHFIDHEKGGWFPALNLEGEPLLRRPKLVGTICPYHNGRMSMEIIERYKKSTR